MSACRLALVEIDRVIAAGVHFGRLGGSGYGLSAPFR